VSGSGGVDREVNSPARAEGGASPAPGNGIEKCVLCFFYMAGVRPSGRTGELTFSVNSASALRGKIFNFADVALSLRAGSLRRPRRFALGTRPATCRTGSAALPPLLHSEKSESLPEIRFFFEKSGNGY